MHKLYTLKDKLVKELEGYESKDLSTGSLDVIDKLAHAAKNLGKVIECCEEDGYSNAYYYDDEPGMSHSGVTYVRPDGSYDRGMSYARGRGRGAKRDSMGRYSRASEDIRHELQELMNKATDEHTKREIRNLMDRM